MSMESIAELRSLAEQSNAWPFEEARKIVARLKKRPKDEVIFETGYGPSGLPHIGTFGEVARTTMVRHAFRVLTDDKIKTRLIAFSDDMDGLRKVPDNVPNQELLATASRQAADPGARSVRHAPELRRAQQCAAARLPRSLRLRLRVHVVDRLLHRGPLRRGAAQGARALRQGDGDHAAVAARGARADLFAVPADRSRTPASCCRCRSSRTTPRPAPSPTRIPIPRSAVDDAGHRRPLQAAMEAGLGDALGRARHRLRDGRQGPDRLGQALGRDLPRARRHAAGRLQLRALPRRERPEDFQVEGQRPHHRRMAALRRRRKACRCSCIASRRRRSGSTSTSSRATSTSISNSSTAIERQDAQAAARQSGLAHPLRRAAEARHADHVPDAADAGVVVERGERRDAVGLHRPLPAGRDAADASEARRAGRLRHPLLPRLRAAGQRNSASRPTPNARR